MGAVQHKAWHTVGAQGLLIHKPILSSLLLYWGSLLGVPRGAPVEMGMPVSALRWLGPQNSRAAHGLVVRLRDKWDLV